MKLKRFEALNLQEALQRVKAEMGPDAVIVSTKRINKGGGLWGLLAQPMIEVTAAVDRESTRTRNKPARPLVAPVRKAVRETVGDQSEDTVRQPWYEPPAGPKAGTPPSSGPSFQDQLNLATVMDPMNQQLSAIFEEMKRLREDGPLLSAALDPLKQEMASMRSLFGELMSERASEQISRLPVEVRETYSGLLSCGVSSDLAYDLVRSVMETLGQDGLSRKAAVMDVLRERMAQAVAVSGPLLEPEGLSKIVMLVGPTGVGKTTTLAKLASQFTCGPHPRKTVVVTLDTYRVAAVEQLRVYTRILKVPLEVAVTPEELPQCLARHRDAELILIDTAGRSPQDPVGPQELSTVVRQTRGIETHLVLAAPTDGEVQREVVRRYGVIPIHRVLFTKIDETHQMGHLFNLIHDVGLPVSYLGTGQRVPEDLAEANGHDIVDRVLARDSFIQPPTHEATLTI